MELSKQEMELFLLFPDLESKNFFYKNFLDFTIGFKAVFLNSKWNYQNRKPYFFLLFPALRLKNFFYKMFLTLVLKKGNGIFRNWNLFSYDTIG